MLNLRYLLDIQLRYQIVGGIHLEFRRGAQVGDINLGVVIMRMVFKTMNLCGDHQKSECGK